MHVPTHSGFNTYTSCHNSHTGARSTYTAPLTNLSTFWLAAYGTLWNKKKGQPVHGIVCLNTSAYMHICVCVIVHIWQAVIRLLTGRRGAASLRCPLFSREEGEVLGGSLCIEILHQSGHSLPGPTERHTERERENEYLLKSRYIQLTNNNTYFVEWYRPHSEEREKIKSKTSTDSATLKDKHTQWCWHRRQPHLVYKYMLWNEMLQKRPGDDWWLFAKTTWETQRVT